MVVVPLSKPQKNGELTQQGNWDCRQNLVALAAAGTLAASGALLATGKRKAGLVTAAAGTALAFLNEPETVKKWWNALPGYIGEAQEMLGRLQKALDDVTANRERVRGVLGK
jgi:hypothetical protein